MIGMVQILQTGNKNGKQELKTGRKLRGFARRFRGKAVAGLVLGDGENAPVIQNMLVAPWGILLVHTCGEKGEYYGQLHEPRWTLIRPDASKATFPNPLRELEAQVTALRAIFAKNKVFKVPIEQVVYIPDTSKKTKLFIKHNGQILQGKALSRMLSREKYLYDNGVDVARVLEVTGAGKS